MEIPHTVTARPDTGLWNAKVGIWLFLASEVMLFGGLFSSYLFLRLSADYPWPHHELDVPFGFYNTLILIASSVFVVFAWASVKMRTYGWFKFWMSLVILCAAGFLVNKGFEYKAKFDHYHVRLKDGSIVAGHIDNKEDKNIRFRATHVNVNYENGDYRFLKFLSNRDDVTFTDPAGQEVDLGADWYYRLRKARELDDQIVSLQAENGDSGKIDKLTKKLRSEYPEYVRLGGDTNVRLAISPSGEFSVSRKNVLSWIPEELTFARKFGAKLEGELVSSSVKIKVDEIDLRMYLQPDQNGTIGPVEEAEAFQYFSETERADLIQAYTAYRDTHLKELEKKKSEWQADNPGETYQGKKFNAFERVMVDDLHGEQHEEAVNAATNGESSEHPHPVATIPFENIGYFSNYGPAKNNYYAIYFTMTGLHGLHVLGGMIVLSYFLFFGKRLYRKNPEHLANRVEVGGLFWHFVDLVWIFLFPIFYLM